MPLSDRLKQAQGETATSEQRMMFFQIKMEVHHEIIEKLDLEALAKLDKGKAAEEVKTLVETHLEKKQIPLNIGEKTQLVKEILDEIFGLGPLETLLTDPDVDDILVNGPRKVYVEKFGKLFPTDITFKDNEHLKRIIDRIVGRIGRRVDESSPMVDARLLDGSRVNVIVPPLALDGPTLSIRRFKANPLTVDDLINFGSVEKEIMILLDIAVKSRLNILVSGGTGTGKTTFLNIISSFIPNDERIITIEDAAELQLRQSHTVRLETRPPNIEGKGQITQRDLVRNSLRMRPDRIIVGEVRGAETLDMLQAMNTGHEGSLTTIHANSPRDALYRIETMVLMAGANLEHDAIVRQIASAIHLVVQFRRYPDGVRRLESLAEIVGTEGAIVTLQEIVRFRQTGINKQGKVEGRFEFLNVRPRFLDTLKEKGVTPDLSLISREGKPVWQF